MVAIKNIKIRLIFISKIKNFEIKRIHILIIQMNNEMRRMIINF